MVSRVSIQKCQEKVKPDGEEGRDQKPKKNIKNKQLYHSKKVASCPIGHCPLQGSKNLHDATTIFDFI